MKKMFLFSIVIIVLSPGKASAQQYNQLIAVAMETPGRALADDRDQEYKITRLSDKDESKFPKDNEKQDQKLAKEFNVNESLINDLRKQKLGYGEIRHVLTIANQMPGGINSANTKEIIEMRQGDENKEGWGHIAQKVGVKLNPQNEKNERVENHENAETHANEHTEKHGMSNESAGMSHRMDSGMGHGGK